MPLFRRLPAASSVNASWALFAERAQLQLARGSARRPPKVSGWFRGAPLAIWGERAGRRATTHLHLALELPPGLDLQLRRAGIDDWSPNLPPTGDVRFDESFGLHSDHPEVLTPHLAEVLTEPARVALLALSDFDHGTAANDQQRAALRATVERGGVRFELGWLVSDAAQLELLAHAAWSLADAVTDWVHRRR